ncbi:MAG: hypothetical protein E6Q88_13010, partial [Lysobacteraceae bacterium]
VNKTEADVQHMAVAEAAAAAEAAAVAASEAAAAAAAKAAMSDQDDTAALQAAANAPVMATASDSHLAKLYFGSGSAGLPADADAALAGVIATLKGSQEAKAVISGYHDASGNAAVNAELAKQRAIGVRDALVAAGIAEDRISLEKPSVTTGEGNPDEARRVEVAVK